MKRAPDDPVRIGREKRLRLADGPVLFDPDLDQNPDLDQRAFSVKFPYTVRNARRRIA
jgi:hypothetical protein